MWICIEWPTLQKFLKNQLIGSFASISLGRGSLDPKLWGEAKPLPTSPRPLGRGSKGIDWVLEWEHEAVVGDFHFDIKIALIDDIIMQLQFDL